MSANHLSHGAAKTTQRPVFVQVESPALSILYFVFSSILQQVGNQSDPMHPCGMSMPFSQFHIFKVFFFFFPRNTPECLLMMQFTAHRGRNTESFIF